MCFNPLHCGAVVASDINMMSSVVRLDVSIPFIAGQWSLHRRHAMEERRASRVSIPFIAGQWSLRNQEETMSMFVTRFNPLHCGAVVASINVLRELVT